MPPLKVILIAEFRNKEEFEKGRKALERIGATAKKISRVTETSTKKMGLNFTLVAWHFRYLGNIMDRVAKSIVKAIKDVITVASELEESFLSISVAGAIFGEDAEKASELARELARTGLMPLQDAANTVKNLMITGLGLPVLEKFMYRYLDIAFLFTSGSDEMTKSLNKTSSAILKGTMLLGTDETMRTLWLATEKRLAKTIGMTMKQLTAEQRALELLVTIEEEWASTQDLHQMEMETTRAAMTRLNFAITEIKNAFGIALLPLLHAVSGAMVKVSVYVRALLKVMGSAVPVIMAVGLAFAWLTAKISFSIGVFISVMRIAGLTAATMWKIYLPILAIGAVIAGLTYLYLKHSGALDKAKQSAANMSAQLERLKETMAGITKVEEEGMGIEEDRKIAHERAVADIEEDLEREVSKGLWANQMTIKDLKKRLNRENEDWRLYLKKRGELEEGGAKTTSSMWDKIFQDATGLAEDLGKIDFWGGLKEKTREMWDNLKEDWEEFKKSLKDPEFWDYVWKNLGESTSSVIGTIIVSFEKLPPVFKGLWAGLITYFLLTALPKIKAGLETLYLTYLITIGKIKTAWLGLATTIASPIAISIAIGAAITAIYLIRDAYRSLKTEMEKMDDALDRNVKSFNQMQELYRAGQVSKEQWLKYLKSETELYGNIADTWTETAEGMETGITVSKIFGGSLFEPLGKKITDWFNFQTGGIVPGMRNQPVPIMAHGGERIIPAGEVAGGGNIEININNPSVRNDRDISEIARQVSQALGQRQKFSRLGSF